MVGIDVRLDENCPTLLQPGERREFTRQVNPAIES